MRSMLAMIVCFLAIAGKVAGETVTLEGINYWDSSMGPYAFMDQQKCGPGDDNHNAFWCVNGGNWDQCPEYMQTSECALNAAVLLQQLNNVQYKYQPDSRIIKSKCHFDFFAMYKCVTPTRTCCRDGSPRDSVTGCCYHEGKYECPPGCDSGTQIISSSSFSTPSCTCDYCDTTCETKSPTKNPTASPTPIPEISPCRTSSCQKTIACSNHKYTFEDAKAKAAELGGKLAEPLDETYNNEIHSVCSSSGRDGDIYIGAKRGTGSNSDIIKMIESHVVIYPVSEDGIFTSWKDGEPNNHIHDNGNGEGCVEMRPDSSLWNDDDCSKENRFAIEFFEAEISPCTSSRCSKTIACSNHKYTFDEAKAKAAELGGKLAEPLDETYNNEIHSACFSSGRADTVYIGAKRGDGDQNGVITMIESTDHVVYPVSEGTFTAWIDGEPNNVEEAYIEMRSSGKWNDGRGLNKQRFAIEFFEVTDSPTTEPTTTSPTSRTEDEDEVFRGYSTAAHAHPSFFEFGLFFMALQFVTN